MTHWRQTYLTSSCQRTLNDVSSSGKKMYTWNVYSFCRLWLETTNEALQIRLATRMQRSLLSSAISFNTRSGRILESLSFSHLPQPPPYFSFQVKLKCWLLADGHVVKMPFKLPTFSHPRPRVSQVIYSTSSPSTAGIWNFSILYRFLNSAIPWFLSWIIHLILHSRKSSLPFFPYYLCLSPSLQRSPSTNSRDV